jgi:ATP-dependent Lhr-like helicase
MRIGGTGTMFENRPPAHADLASLFEPYVWAWFKDTFGEPSPPQIASWPRIAQGQNALILAPTGSGKTLAAFLWCINELFRLGVQQALADQVYVLYVSPLKALNNDIQKNLLQPLRGIRAYARAAGVDVPVVRSAVRTGDTTQRQRAAMVRRPPHILITTPESLYIILATSRFREAFRQVRYVIVDEIHAVSDDKRGIHLALSLERLEHLVRAGREDLEGKVGAFSRIGLSATQKPLDEIARFLVGMDHTGQPRPCEIIDTGARKGLDVQVIAPVDNLLEAQVDAIWGSAYEHLLSMIREHETTLVFTNSRYKAERTALRLAELAGDRPVRAGAHHGSLSRQVRLEMEDQLKQGKLDALVATASLELGIDVGSVDLVCQVQSPKSVSTGTQRIGRAGHLLGATSKGRLLAMDRDDLVESAVLVKAIVDGEIDTTRIPANCLDVLAQQVVGAVAADDWNADDLYALCRQAYPYRDLDRADYERVLDMLSGGYVLDMERAPYPKLNWDRVNNMLYPERSARLIAFRSSGTIPDVQDYDVYLVKNQTRVGQLDEGFVEKLHTGDIFCLGTSSWQVIGFERNRVLVEDVYGRAPTIPFWGGDRGSRTYDLGLLVGLFRRELEAQMAHGDPLGWLQRTYHVDRDGAQAICAYLREQQMVTGQLPSDRLLLVEQFRDELGLRQVVIHSPFGVRVHDPWAMALSEATAETYGFHPQTATVDDGILMTIPADARIDEAALASLYRLVTPESLDRLLRRAVFDAPVFASRFRHNAVRALMVLREYRGRRTPVWLQSLRASALLEACRDDSDFPLIVETLRECLHESLDVPNLRRVLAAVAAGEIEVQAIETRIPSPLTHALLLVGQYGDAGTVPARERRSRLMHLHREVLKQILDRDTLRNLLDESAVKEVDARLQRRHIQRQARDANELARVLLELGDLVTYADDEISILDRAPGDPLSMLDELVSQHRAVQVPIPTVETNRERWIATENVALYRAAWALEVEPDQEDRSLLCLLGEHGPLTVPRLAELCGQAPGRVKGRLEKLYNSYQVLSLGDRGERAYVATGMWVPAQILEERPSREQARLALVRQFLRAHGPVTKYEVMGHYGLAEAWVEHALDVLVQEGGVVQGEYVPTKAVPQWCYRRNLEQIHRLTLNRLRKEMEPATAEEYADFLLRWQHLHPQHRLAGIAGLREVIEQIQGQENYQIVYEQDLLAGRVQDYDPSMLDRLCYRGEVYWRRFDHTRIRRGYIGFCLRQDRDWIVPDPDQIEMVLDRWDEDIPEACNTVRTYLRQHGACFFDDIVEDTGLDWRLVLRAAWHLIWTGEATNDSYESIRHARVGSGLSACYDLATRPGRKGVTLDLIVRHMLENRRLDPRLGRWAPTERLVPAGHQPPDKTALRWAELLLRRYGVFCREWLSLEVAAPPWKDLRRALVELELLGRVRRGYLIEGLAGEQYALPEAVDALYETKLRHLDVDDHARANSPASEPAVLMSACDPANPFGSLFELATEMGDPVKFMRTPFKYLVLQGGRPLVFYEGRITVLVDLARAQAERALRALMALVNSPDYDEVSIRAWNGHPIDVSPARHLLSVLGFVQVENRWRGFVYDGLHEPDAEAVAAAERQVPAVFEHVNKEQAPVTYDAEWLVSRADEQIRPKVRELIAFLQRHLPPEGELVYHPRELVVRYRGFRCARPHIQKKQIRLHITHKGWVPGLVIGPETDLSDPAFEEKALKQLQRTCQAIDRLLADKAS